MLRIILEVKDLLSSLLEGDEREKVLRSLSYHESEKSCFSCDTLFKVDTKNDREEGYFCDCCIVNLNH